MMALNVLYISHYSGLEGGANLSLLYLMEEMQKKGVNVYLLLPYKNSKVSLPYRLRGIRVIAYKYDWWMKENKDISIYSRCFNLFSNYLSAYRISDIIRKHDINIIHTNSSVINIGGLIGRINRIPHVWHIREFGKEDYNLVFLFGQWASMNFMYQNSDRIVAISKSIYDKYSVYLKDKLQLIHNGISRAYINKKDKQINNEIKSVLLAGSIISGKGQLEAIKAIYHIVKAGYTDLHLTIAGPVLDTEYDRKLKDMVYENDLQKYVSFIAFQKDLRALRQVTDIELVCSKSEAFGRVTIEAMLSMNPVIGSNSGGTKELIIDGYNGLLYKCGDHIELADKIKYLIDRPEELKQMGENAFSYALENFTAEKNAEEIYKVYCEVLSNSSRRQI